MTLNGIIALILFVFFTEFDCFAGQHHSGSRQTYNVCKILSPSSSLPLLAKPHHSMVSVIAELFVLHLSSGSRGTSTGVQMSRYPLSCRNYHSQAHSRNCNTYHQLISCELHQWGRTGNEAFSAKQQYTPQQCNGPL